MFYAKKPDDALRFGDVLQGYPSTTPIIKEPILGDSPARYNIDVDLSKFTVVMDPSCEIRNRTISLTPLVQIPKNVFYNPYFVEDLTRVNREMNPQQAIPPKAWSELGVEQQQSRLNSGPVYACLSLFIYEKYGLFPPYTVRIKDEEDNLRTFETNYYMIDFRNTYKVCCDKIQSPEESPLHSRALQLSNETRNELTLKLLNYYKRILEEDKGEY